MKKFEVSTIYNDKLTIDPLFLSEGLNYASKHNLTYIKISPINAYTEYGFDNPKELYNFSLDTEHIKGCYIIRDLYITDYVKLDSNKLEDIYTIPNLKLLSFEDKSFKLDFSRLQQLETLYFTYNKGITNLGALKNLKDLLIFSLNVPSCEILSELTGLEMLRLTRGNFTTLKGIENLKNVKRIDVAYNSKLTDAKFLTLLPSLEKLHIEKCKLLTDFSFLKGNTSIKELFIDNLDSIDFVATMPNLEKINFWACKDGNMNPVLESKSLKQINFYPNKKHYSHTIEEVIELTGAQRGRNK